MSKFSMTKQKFCNQWLRHFAQGLTKDQYKKYVENQFIWHVFSWELLCPDELLIGDAKKVVYNMVQDIMIESDRDIKKHVTTHSGYARGSGALIAPKAFAKLTVTQG